MEKCHEFKELCHYGQTSSVSDYNSVGLHNKGEVKVTDELYQQAGRRILFLRENQNYTREKLSELANISSKFLYDIEYGHKGFSAKTLYKIASALDVSCDYIMCGDLKNNRSEKQ